METPEKTLYFLVLVPHRDCLPSLEAYRRVLFSMGFNGAFSFPAAAPLALLDRPLDSVAIKASAAELRELLGDKKVTPRGLETSSVEASVGEGSFHFMGPVLDMPLPSLSAAPGGEAPVVLQRWEKPLLAPAILGPDTNNRSFTGVLPDFFSFRAMALANLSFTVTIETAPEFDSFDSDYSFTWELGPLRWLPRTSRGALSPRA